MGPYHGTPGPLRPPKRPSRAGTPLDLRTIPPNSIGNLSNAADHSGVIEAVDQLESISVCDAVATDTAKFADCILPATSLPLLFEEGDS